MFNLREFTLSLVVLLFLNFKLDASIPRFFTFGDSRLDRPNSNLKFRLLIAGPLGDIRNRLPNPTAIIRGRSNKRLIEFSVVQQSDSDVCPAIIIGPFDRMFRSLCPGFAIRFCDNYTRSEYSTMRAITKS